MGNSSEQVSSVKCVMVPDSQSDNCTDNLVQAHSGVFQLLPLGLRVQDKIEKLIDKHMQSVGL